MSKPLDLNKIVIDRLDSKNDYFPDIHPKRQIYIHHAESHPDPAKVIETWRKRHSRTSASLVIAGKPYDYENFYRDGDIFSAFPSKYWAMHLKVHHSENKVPGRFKTKEHTRFLEKYSIAIVICNAGPLSWENGRFFSSFRTVVPEEEVIEYVDGYRGQRFYHKYTEAQIESLGQLLVYLAEKFELPIHYQPDMWNISEDALLGKKGIFTLASVRTDRASFHPQPSLLEMLMNLYKKEPSPATKVEPTSDKDNEEQAPDKEEEIQGEEDRGQTEQQEPVTDDSENSKE